MSKPTFEVLAESLSAAFKAAQPVFREMAKQVDDATMKGRQQYEQQKSEIEEEHRELERKLERKWRRW